MSIIPDTNYYITNSQGEKVDISTIFNSGTCPTTTYFKFYNTIITTPAYVDLSTVINSIQPGDTPLDDTGYKVTISPGVTKDLSEIFQPKITEPNYYTITSTPAEYNTKEVQKDGYYYIAFPYYTTNAIATITFNQNISNINVIVVGGGGCGVKWSNYYGNILSGGGGGGGGVAQATFNATTGDSYNISIGQGGQAPNPDSPTGGSQTTFTSVSSSSNNIICTGGGVGVNYNNNPPVPNYNPYALGGIGTVSGSIFFNINAGTGGDGGQYLTTSTKGPINDGGNSVIPSLIVPSGPFPYGLGGGGGAGDFQSPNGGSAGNGTGGICGAAPTGQGATPNGFGCGGGGCAYSSLYSPTEFNTPSLGNNGLVLIYFNIIYDGIWPYINLNNKNNRQSIYNGPSSTNPPLLKWSYEAPSGASFNENQLVIGPTGIIYIAEDNGAIYALQDSGISASLLFSYDTGYPSLLPPVIGTNNIMYFAGTNMIKAVQNINTNIPSVLWSLPITSPPLTNPKTPIIGSNNTMYLSTSNGYIFAINNIYSTGTLKWSYNISGANPISNLAIGSDGTIYATAFRYMYAVTDNGVSYTLKWTSPLLSPGSGLSAPSIGPDGTIYTMYSNTIYAVNASDGTKKWTSGLVVGSLSLYGFISISNNGTLYVVSNTTVNSISDNGLSGVVNWICTTNSALRSVAIGNNGAIYSTGDYGYIIRITDNGSNYTLNWSFQAVLAAGFSSPCAISNNGTIYYGGDHNFIIAIN
jgi:hypothetical protein